MNDMPRFRGCFVCSSCSLNLVMATHFWHPNCVAILSPSFAIHTSKARSVISDSTSMKSRHSSAFFFLRLCTSEIPLHLNALVY